MKDIWLLITPDEEGRVYGRMLRLELEDAGYTVEAGDVINLGVFKAEFIHVNHSIPGAVALAIKCDSGTIVQTGDFKIDTTPEEINIYAKIYNER